MAVASHRTGIETALAQYINYEVDARLMAAAPELLEAAKLMLRFIESMGERDAFYFDALTAAVAKAESSNQLEK